jgi:hypothetical protein
VDLYELEKLDGLRAVEFAKCKCFIHNEHRWNLPLIFEAQKSNIIERPCKLIVFDFHDDSLEPGCVEDIRKIRGSGINYNNLIELCRTGLNKQDDDWLKSAMELGMISDAIIFEVMCQFSKKEKLTFNDHGGKQHRIRIIKSLANSLIYPQGELSDITREKEYGEIWEILGMQFIPQEGFKFKEPLEKIILDIDLDCFTMKWVIGQEYIFPWPDDIFVREFATEFGQWPIKWSGKMIFNKLVEKAALITIAREEDFCGGKEKCDHILKKANHYLFDDHLQV